MSHIIDQPIDTRHGGGDVFPGHAGRFRRNETTCVESGNFKESQLKKGDSPRLIGRTGAVTAHHIRVRLFLFCTGKIELPKHFEILP